MRTWVKVTLGVVALVVLCILALGGTAAYFVLGNLDKRPATEADSAKVIEEVRVRFASKPPLLEIIDPRRGDVRINRLQEASTTPVSTVHVASWNSDDGELTRTEIPLWLMRFSSVNILSQLGIAPAKYRVTVDDIKRYGPGIIADYTAPGSFRVFVWVD